MAWIAEARNYGGQVARKIFGVSVVLLPKVGQCPAYIWEFTRPHRVEVGVVDRTMLKRLRGEFRHERSRTLCRYASARDRYIAQVHVLRDDCNGSSIAGCKPCEEIAGRRGERSQVRVRHGKSFWGDSVRFGWCSRIRVPQEVRAKVRPGPGQNPWLRLRCHWLFSYCSPDVIVGSFNKRRGFGPMDIVGDMKK